MFRRGPLNPQMWGPHIAWIWHWGMVGDGVCMLSCFFPVLPLCLHVLYLSLCFVCHIQMLSCLLASLLLIPTLCCTCECLVYLVYLCYTDMKLYLLWRRYTVLVLYWHLDVLLLYQHFAVLVSYWHYTVFVFYWYIAVLYFTDITLYLCFTDIIYCHFLAHDTGQEGCRGSI